MTHALKLALVLAAAAGAVSADTRVKADIGFSSADPDDTSVQAAFGYGVLNDLSSGMRVMTDGSSGDFRYELHLNWGLTKGDSIALADLIPSTPPPPSTLFDLSESYDSGSDGQVDVQIDRAWLSYTTDQTVIKVGRQAITWGNGLVFHPGDIVAPFSPNAIDTSHKPGVDMVYGQYLFDSGADVQAIYVPRPETAGGPVSPDASTLAVRGYTSLGAVDASLTVAQDRGDQAIAFGLSGSLGGAGWKAEVVDWQLASGTVEPSWVVSLTNFGSLGDVPISYFAEYYHNGFGTSSSVPVDALPATLTKRMSTGQVFYPGTDYLALGAQLMVSPDLSLAPSAIIALEDESALITIGGNYNLGDNSDLSFVGFMPLGDDGTEFGGRETSSGSGIYLGAAAGVSVRFTQYF